MSESKKLPIAKSVLAFGAVLVMFVVFPAYLFYDGQWHEGFRDLRWMYFAAIVVVIFLTNASFFFLLARSDKEQLVHVIVLLVAIASFYAFGWPREFASHSELAPEVMSEALAHKFSELCVVLVLFLLSELAVKLNYDAAEVRRGLREEFDRTRGAIASETTKTVDAIGKASGGVRDAVEELKSVASAIGAAQLVLLCHAW